MPIYDEDGYDDDFYDVNDYVPEDDECGYDYSEEELLEEYYPSEYDSLEDWEEEQEFAEQRKPPQ